MKYTLKWIFRALFYEDLPENPPKEIATTKSIAPENYGAVIDPWAEIARLRRALCEYQLKYWTIQYKLSLFSIEGDA